VVYYYGVEACSVCRAYIEEAGGWKERPGKPELAGVRSRSGDALCLKDQSDQNHSRESNGFTCTSGKSCSLSDEQKAIPSRILDKASQTIYFLSAAVTEDDLKQDAHDRAKAVINALYEAANLETRFDSRQELI